MDDEIDRLLAGMRADAGLGREVEALRAALDGPLAAGAERAGRAVETSLLRAVRNGRLGFEDLRRSALATMDAIAASALRSGVDGLFGGVGGLGGALVGLVAGAPGRATGGAVSPGRSYWVGERGPELMVPASAGSVVAAGSPAREVRVAITINASGGNAAADVAPAALRQSSRQVARAVRAALMEA